MLGIPRSSVARAATFALTLTTFALAEGGLQPGELRPHLISLGNNGLLLGDGPWAQTPGDLDEIFLDGAGGQAGATEAAPELFLYAHGGMVTETNGLTRVPVLKDLLLPQHIYPVAFVWRTDFVTTLKNIVRDAFRQARVEVEESDQSGAEWDLLDPVIERIAHNMGGTAIWGEMKANAVQATRRDEGGARAAADSLAALARRRPGTRIHLGAHSAGSILFGPFVQLLTRPDDGGASGYGLRIETVSLMAPAITVDFFKQTYLPALAAGRIGRLRIFNLDDEHERNDWAGPYGKSILYLIRNALEPTVPTRVLGLERSFQEDPELAALVAAGRIELVITPNDEPLGSQDGSRADAHTAFEWDDATQRAIYRTIRPLTGAATE